MTSLSLVELRQQVEFAERNSGVSAPHALEFWRRVLSPLAVLAFALLGATLVLAVRPRSGGGLVILLGIAAAIGLYLFQQIGMNTASKIGFEPFVAAALPTAILIALALGAAHRVNEGPH